MPGMDGMEATRRLRVVCPESKVLALTVHVDKQYFLEMLAAGAVGYVSKQAAADDLLQAIRVIASGGVHLTAHLAAWLLEDYHRLLSHSVPKSISTMEKSTVDKNLEILSDRELQVLELVAMGKANIQIGEILEISPKTVARHRERIMTKLDIHSSVDLVRYAIRNGLVTLT